MMVWAALSASNPSENCARSARSRPRSSSSSFRLNRSTLLRISFCSKAPSAAVLIERQPRQPAFDRVTRRGSVAEDALGARDNTLVIAVQNFQEQRILVAKGRIEARLGEAGGCGNVVERSALESFSPEHVAREVQRLVGIKAARSCHRTYVRADREIAKGGVDGPATRNLHQGLASTAAPPGGVTGRRNRMRWYSQPIATSTRPKP